MSPTKPAKPSRRAVHATATADDADEQAGDDDAVDSSDEDNDSENGGSEEDNDDDDDGDDDDGTSRKRRGKPSAAKATKGKKSSGKGKTKKAGKKAKGSKSIAKSMELLRVVDELTEEDGAGAGAGAIGGEEMQHLFVRRFCSEGIRFAEQMAGAIPVLCQLMTSKNVTDVVEAVRFLTKARTYGLPGNSCETCHLDIAGGGIQSPLSTSAHDRVRVPCACACALHRNQGGPAAHVDAGVVV